MQVNIVILGRSTEEGHVTTMRVKEGFLDEWSSMPPRRMERQNQYVRVKEWGFDGGKMRLDRATVTVGRGTMRVKE